MLSVCLAPAHQLSYVHILCNYACTCVFGGLRDSSIACQARSKSFVPEHASSDALGCPKVEISGRVGSWSNWAWCVSVLHVRRVCFRKIQV